MRHSVVAAIGGVAIIATSISGCAAIKEANELKASNSPTPTSTAPVVHTPGSVALTLDGAEQQVEGPVTCSGTDTVHLKIGKAPQLITAQLGSGPMPIVDSVSLGNYGGTPLAFQSWGNHGNATATAQGTKIKISGTAVSSATEEASQRTSSSFELDVTCPT